MDIKGVIFDLDGTLLYTLRDLGESLNHVLAKAGLPTFPLAAYRFMVGNGIKKLVWRAVPETWRGTAREQGIYGQFMEYYGAHQFDTTRPYEGLADMLAGLRGAGLKLAVLSNKAHPNTVAIIDHYFPHKPFDMVLGLREGRAPKPDPAGALEIAGALGLAPGQCAYAGDSDVDMATARAAGMFAAGVLWGYRDQEELTQAGAQALLGSPAEFKRYFNG